MTKLRLVYGKATRREATLRVVVVVLILVFCLIFTIDRWW
jgi:hypothetical protein